MPIQPQTTPGALRRAANDFPDATAIIDGDTRLTFGDLAAQVDVVSRALIARGILSGDRIAIWAPNTYQWVVAALAVHSVGAALVPINTRYTSAEALDIVTRTQSKAVFAAGSFLSRHFSVELAGSTPLVVRIGAGEPNDTAVPFDDLGYLGGSVETSVLRARADAVRADDVSDILFTSGTTGQSKGALSAHRQALGVARAWAECTTLGFEDRLLLINPFFHSFGYKAGILAALSVGAVIVPKAVYDVEDAMATIEHNAITVLPGAPTIFSTILDHARRDRYDLSSLRVGVTGAAVVPIVLVERMQAELKLQTVVTAYGLTEAVVATMCRPGDDAVTIATTSGRAAAGFEIRIGDSDEILLRGPNVMLGYLDDADATAAAIDADGWLHTGDVGRLDDRGYLTITDRLKDMYICGGFNVYPAEVEQTLARLDGVSETAVIGVPDDRLGEVGKAFVVLQSGFAVSESDVIAYCREHLANFKVPRSVSIVGTLPRNASGKLLKTTLRKEFS